MTATRPAPRWHLAAPIVYILLIGGLLYLQFGGPRRTVRRTGAIEVHTSTTRGLRGRDLVRDVQVLYGPVRIPLASGLTLRDPAGALERPRPTGAQVSDAGGVISLGGRLEVSFQDGPSGMVVWARPLGDLPLPVRLEVPLAIDGSAPMRPVEGFPILWARADGCTLYVSGAEGSRLESGRASLTLRNAAPVAILRVETCTQVEDPYEYWFSRDDGPSDAQSLERAVTEFLRRSYPAWRARLSVEGADLLSQDRLVVAYLAEALRRGTYAAEQSDLQVRVARLFRGTTAADSLPAAYLGLTRAYEAAQELRSQAVVREVLDRVSRADTAVFGVPAVVSTVLNHGATTLMDQLLALAAAVDVDTAPAGTLVDVARFYIDVEEALGVTEGLNSRLENILTGRLLPALRRTDVGTFFLPDPDAPVALERTLQMGRLLTDAGRILAREPFAAVGRRLTISALALAASDGSLPREVGVTEGALRRSVATLGSEVAYAYLAETADLPRVLPLRTELGPGAWLLTAARVREMSAEEGSLRLEYRFTVGQSHYLMLRGVPPIASLLLHDTPWRPDPEYFRYSDGWWYSPETRTLHAKITQQREWEEISLRY